MYVRYSVERKSHFQLSEENITASLNFFSPTNHLVILIYLKCVSPCVCLCERESERLLGDGFMRRTESVYKRLPRGMNLWLCLFLTISLTVWVREEVAYQYTWNYISNFSKDPNFHMQVHYLEANANANANVYKLLFSLQPKSTFIQWFRRVFRV